MLRRTSLIALFAGIAVIAAPSVFAHGERALATVDPRCGPNLTALITSDGRFVGCTHGPDPAPEGVDLNKRKTLRELTLAASGRTLAAAPGVPCVGTGSDGKRVQAMYVRTQSTASRFAAVSPLIRLWAGQTSDAFNATAAEQGGKRQLRFVTTGAAPNCVVSVMEVVLPNTADDGMGNTSMINTVNAMIAKGFNKPNRKYLMWFDTSGHGICGIASLRNDDSPGTTNQSNGTGWSRIDSPCWSTMVFDIMVEAHEVMHNLGGVQASAPHKTPAGHCSDEFDTMCYRDVSPPPRLTYPCSILHEHLFDCGRDDYFNVNPPAGSYLATHWNTARSLYLAAPATPPNDRFATAQPLTTGLLAPGSTTMFGLDVRVGSNVGATAQPGEPATAGVPATRSVWYQVTTPDAGRVLTLDTHGSTFDTVVGVYRGTFGALNLDAANDNAHPGFKYSRVVVRPTVAGATYFIKVDGKAGATGSVMLHLGYGGAPGADITGFTPAAATIGQPVTIAGTDLFGGGFFPLFNGVFGPLPDSFFPLRMKVPNGAATGQPTDTATGPILLMTTDGWGISDNPLKIKPSISSLSANQAARGTNVTINGQALLGSLRPTVKINGVVATIVSWTYQRVVVKVPAGAPVGAGTLTVTTNGGTASRAFTVT